MISKLKAHWPVFVLGAVYFALFLSTAGRYGIFRDELYYIDCARHMAWGYVDHPPFSIALLWGVIETLGDSILAIRLIPLLCGLAGIGLTWILTLRIGGSRFAAYLASLAWFANPTFLSLTNFYSMNALDLIFWLAGFLLAAEWIRTRNDRLLLGLGIAGGLGLLNKYSMGFWLLSFGIALAVSIHRKALLRPWIWSAVLIAALLFAPHIIWQAQHGWPTLEFMQNAASYKIAQISPVALFSELIKTTNPVNILIWLPGLAALFFWKPLRPYRLFGIMTIVFFSFMMVQNPKVYYLTPVFPVLYAAGAARLSRFFSGKIRWARTVLVSFMIASAIFLLPLAVPILPPETLALYLDRTGIAPQPQEKSETGILPQHFADRFGWEELAKMVSGLYSNLPEYVRNDIAVFTDNYGEAGAIHYFSSRYPLPPAISGHNNYYLWGPGSISGKHLLVIGSHQEDLEQYYEKVTLLGRFSAPYVMPYEYDLPVYYCTGPKVPLEKIWEETRHYI